MENDIITQLKNKTTVDHEFIDKFSSYILDTNTFISFTDVKQWIGYKKKHLFRIF